MDSPGVVRGKRIEKIGMKCSDTAQLFFEDVRVPKKNIIGQEGKGFIYQMQQFQQERIYAVAITLKALEMSINSTIEVSQEILYRMERTRKGCHFDVELIDFWCLYAIKQ